MALYDVNSNLIYSGDGEVEIKSYFSNEMNDTISKVRALLTEPCLVFPMCTDIHWKATERKPVGSPETFDEMIDNMRRFTSHVKCDFVLNLGDNTDGKGTDDEMLSDAAYQMKRFREIGLPYFQAIGNHDDGRYGGKLNLAQMYEAYMSNVPNFVYKDSSMTGSNFYVDFPSLKIRLIVYNSNDNNNYGTSAATVTWLLDEALDTPEDYAVLLASHIAPIATCNYKNNAYGQSADITAAIETYKETKPVIAFLYGHSHVDVSFTSPYNLVGTNCAKFENDNGSQSDWPAGAVKPYRTANDYTEDCWDAVVVRPSSRKINFVRFGAGTDREFSY